MSSSDSETRKRILEQTRRLMVERRGKDVHLEDIAQAAGVSRQAVYMHFGSRSGLLTATARYLDEILGLSERARPVENAPSGLQMLDAYVDFWAHYVPDIYGLATALLAVRETDEAASAAWADRMEAVYRGCRRTVLQLEREGLLSSGWTIEEAADFFWMMLSLQTWENLTIERGWTTEQYIKWLQLTLRRAFTCRE